MKTTEKKSANLKVLDVQSVSNLSFSHLLSSAMIKVQKMGHSLLRTLTTEPELRIWTKTDRLGNIFWYAYDPFTGKSTVQASEDEMRVWIEQRYNA